MKTLKVKLTFTEELLGTAPGNPEIYEEFIASKSPDASTLEEEVAAIGVDEVVDKTMTIFPRNEKGMPILYDYQIRGFFKEACSFLRKIGSNKSSKLKAFKKQIDGLVFVKPRMIELNFDGFPGKCQRPLRASTPQGERIALANSETAPVGTTCEFEVHCFDESDIELVREWLDYGEWHGIGQWRNSGKGSFTWEEIE